MGSHFSRGQFYLNREIAQLDFNARVLALAEDRKLPLLERLAFLCIVDSNLDEFFEIRVAGLKEKIAGEAPAGPDGMLPKQVFQHVSQRAHDLVAKQYKLLKEDLLERLAAQGIQFLQHESWNREQKEWLRDYFFREVMPVLTPIGLDPAHPFPRLLNKSLNFAIELAGKDAFGRNGSMAIVQAPRVLPRVIALPPALAGCEHGFVLLGSIIHAHVDELFPGMTVRGCYQFQLTRNSDLYIDEEELRELKSLRTALQGELPHRQFGDCVRLEVERSCPPKIVSALLEQFKLKREDLYQVDGPVNMVRLAHVVDAVPDAALKFPPFEPGVPSPLCKCEDLFAAIHKGDILLHHPYQSFKPVIAFIQQAANDPAVVAIKQTVYRTGLQSQMMELLIEAARNGKAVTVVVELLARFDEETNINWAQRLEAVGAHVVYGVVGHKTHATMAMVVRREEGRLRRYVHLATGNYHSRTARLYTDFALFTCNEEICADVNDVFMQLTGLAKAAKLRHLWQSPFSLHQRIKQAIRNEIHNAQAGRKALVMAKMNALLEPEMIALLYEASQAGVRVDLVVRGVCALRPGVPGMSENIRVRSVLGRFLEHSRVFYFYNDGVENVYLASADWMDRNFFRRIEVCFPVLDAKLKRRVIREGLQVYLARNADAWDMDRDGAYVRPRKRNGKRIDVQSRLL
ncbi:MAG TPA: polyphosphate kinase 1, partial [Burkholderiales bacterium]|nr:polyphosphate kinase 1 [Burkholderiales bacterium]